MRIHISTDAFLSWLTDLLVSIEQERNATEQYLDLLTATEEKSDSFGSSPVATDLGWEDDPD